MSTAREIGDKINQMCHASLMHHKTETKVAALVERLVSLAQPGEGALTDEQLWDMRSAAKSDPRTVDEHWFILFARAVEAHHGIGSKK